MRADQWTAEDNGTRWRGRQAAASQTGSLRWQQRQTSPSPSPSPALHIGIPSGASSDRKAGLSQEGHCPVSSSATSKIPRTGRSRLTFTRSPPQILFAHSSQPQHTPPLCSTKSWEEDRRQSPTATHSQHALLLQEFTIYSLPMQLHDKYTFFFQIK